MFTCLYVDVTAKKVSMWYISPNITNIYVLVSGLQDYNFFL